MTPETQKQYEELFATFGTEGWKLYMEEVNARVNTLTANTLYECANSEQLAVRRGQVDSLQYSAGFESSVRQNYDMTLEDETDEGS